MTINLKLLTSEALQAGGYPLTYVISHNGKRKKYQIGLSRPEHFIESECLISKKHPDYDILMPEITAFSLKARAILVKRPDDIAAVYDAMFGKPVVFGSFYSMANEIIEDMKARASDFEKRKMYESSGKLYGGAKAYRDALSSFNGFKPDVALMDIDYALLLKYRNARENAGNSKATIAFYLRELRALYNKILKLHKIDDTNKPFAGAFAGLTVKSHASRKKNVSRAVVEQIEGIKHTVESMHRWTDLWLLQFYFAGSDLKDVYYLKHAQLRNGRVYFTRAKTDTEVIIDLAIHPKAQAIIDKYKTSDGEYLFPWRKDTDGYKTFRHKMSTVLIKIQKRYGIELEGMGGNLGIKVARHTFANLGKQLYTDPELLGELQGHLSGDVSNYYKDRFPQAARDEAHFRIIG